MLFGISYLEWFGYLASVVVAVSLIMSSIVKLRWYNLFGAGMFSVYGFMIGALPVGFLNGFIALADIYYLIQIYKEKEYFEMMELNGDSQYLKYFLEYQKDDINKFFPEFKYSEKANEVGFYLLRNLTPAGIIFGEKKEGEFEIKLDYVLPEYRDFKIGKYVFEKHIGTFKEKGIKKISTKSENEEHTKYLQKMGFKLRNENIYEKNI